MPAILHNLNRVRDTVATAAAASGRRPEDVKLIAVSKMHSIASIEAAVAAGQHAFGESTVQEALGKIAHFTGPSSQTTPEWHFIGHLQSNKAKFVPGHFSWIHSLDSLKLAQRLSRVAQQEHATLNALIEVNINRDPGKHGIDPEQAFPLIEQLLQHELPGVALRGLMTIGPYPAAEPDIRRTYAALRALRDACYERYALAAFTELSMGMSGDYVAAIQEGSTMIRVGTAIFGERDYG